VEGADVVRWEYRGKQRSIPSVFHEAWTSQVGRFAVALANWTDRPRKVRVRDARLGARAAVHVAADSLTRRETAARSGRVDVVVPPLAMVLVEAL
jgi:hypothetical protein